MDMYISSTDADKLWGNRCSEAVGTVHTHTHTLSARSHADLVLGSLKNTLWQHPLKGSIRHLGRFSYLLFHHVLWEVWYCVRVIWQTLQSDLQVTLHTPGASVSVSWPRTLWHTNRRSWDQITDPKVNGWPTLPPESHPPWSNNMFLWP